jgi:hypothetical protein
MRRPRPSPRFRPVVERCEEKQLLSAVAATATPLPTPGAGTVLRPPIPAQIEHKYKFFRITQPNPINANPLPPFEHVFVQTPQPQPGTVYDVFSIGVRNGTPQTFTSADSLYVKLSNEKQWFPVLTGAQTWKPGQEIIFYTLTHRFYPVPNTVTNGFEFEVNGSFGTFLGGPSATFQKITYTTPERLGKALDYILIRGSGSYRHRLGLPVTNLYQFSFFATQGPQRPA